MEFLTENWFFILVLLACFGMHFFGHGHGHQHGRGDAEKHERELEQSAKGDHPRHARPDERPR